MEKKDNLHIIAVKMIDPVTGWFEIVQYNDKISICVANRVETTLLSR